MESLNLSSIKFHKNNLVEMELILNMVIQKKGKVDINFFTSGIRVSFKEVKKVMIGYWNENVRIKLIKSNDSTNYNDFEFFEILANGFVYTISTGSGSKAGEESKYNISFHEVTSDELKKFYRKS